MRLELLDQKSGLALFMFLHDFRHGLVNGNAHRRDGGKAASAVRACAGVQIIHADALDAWELAGGRVNVGRHAEVNDQQVAVRRLGSSDMAPVENPAAGGGGDYHIQRYW